MSGQWTNYWKSRNASYDAPVKLKGQEWTITVKLGFIKRRGESKYQWVVLPSDKREDWPVKKMMQGTASSREEAMKKVESFWSYDGKPTNQGANQRQQVSHSAAV